MNSPILSICIPTYNRDEFIIKSLNSVLPQITEQVEIVISNNGSTDNTKSQVEAFIKEHPEISITLVNQETNLGFDKNVLAVVAAARGEYCWLISDDDTILPNGIETLLNLISSQPTVSNFVVNYRRFDKREGRITAPRMLNLTEDIISSDPDAFYFKELPESYFYILGTNMITMSVNVFKRDYWQTVVPTVQEYMGLNFIHIFILTTVMQQHPSLYFVAEPQAEYLQHNHRDWDNDIWGDYKKLFLPYLTSIGYNADNVNSIIASTINRKTKPTLLQKFRVAVGKFLKR